MQTIPVLKDYFDIPTGTLSYPVSLNDKKGIVSFPALPVLLHDMLVDFGAETATIEQPNMLGQLQQTRVICKFVDIDFALLSFIAEYTQSQPIYIESVFIDAASKPGVLTSATLVFIVEVLP